MALLSETTAFLVASRYCVETEEDIYIYELAPRASCMTLHAARRPGNRQP